MIAAESKVTCMIRLSWFFRCLPLLLILLASPPTSAGIITIATGPDGGTIVTSGSKSQANLNLGTFIVDAGTKSSVYKLRNNGTASGITYSKVGDITSISPGSPFLVGANKDALLTLVFSMASVGNRSGTATIQNSTNGLDQKDLITLMATVLDHANGSFDSLNDVDSLVLDFGTVLQGTTPELPFSISDLVNPSFGSSLTSGLYFDSYSGLGDTAILTTDLTSLLGDSMVAAPGNTASFTASFDTSVTGLYGATYDLIFKDDPALVGSRSHQLSLTLLGEVVAPVAAVPEPASLIIWCGLGVGSFLAARGHRRPFITGRPNRVH